jgi:putrescine importer
MGQNGALPRRFFGTLNPVRRIPQNNPLLVGVIVLIGSLAMSYQLGTELLNYGALLAFVDVNAVSAVLAWQNRGCPYCSPVLAS